MGTTLFERVDGLGELVESQVTTMEQDRRLTDEVVAAIRATGLNRAWVPAELGGDERHVVEVLEAIERIAAFDGSTGWCASIGAGSNLFAGFLPQAVAAEVWADPDQGNAGMFGPFGNVRANGDGLTLTGRWPFCSNSLHSAWIGLGAFWFGDAEEAEPIPRLVLVPMSDVTVEPTWDAPGLCATGSHHASVEGAVVERERSVSFVDPPWAEGPLWRLPLFCLLAPGLGDHAVGHRSRRARRGGQAHRRQRRCHARPARRRPRRPGRLRRGRHGPARRRAGLMDACARAWDCAERGERVPKVLQAQVMMAMNYGCQVAVDATSTAHRLGGGGAAYAGSSLLRRLRDVETARQHIMFGQGSRPMLAKTLAGEDTFAPPFIV